MKKSRIFFIASLMALALIGLVVLQLNWIWHDLEIREERFSQQVQDALNKAISKMETRESVSIIAKNIPWVFQDSLVEYFGEIPEPPEPPVFKQEINHFFRDSVLNDELVSIIHSDDSLSKNVRIVTGSGNSHSKKMIVSVNSKNNSEEIILDQEQINEMERQAAEMDKKQAEFQRRIAATEAEHAKIQLKRFGNVINKMAVEYERKDLGLLQRLNPMAIDSLVGFELRNNGIKMPYSIELYAGAKDTLIWERNHLSANNASVKSYKANLFPGDIINRHDFVKVGFTDTLSYFLSTMWFMLLSSAFFTLAIIGIFSYTVFVILRQKKLSEIRTDFINNMTHEFKTPIATIRLASDALTNKEVINNPEKIKFYTGIINDENDRMNSHVENILQMALFDKKAFAPDLAEVNMHDVIANSVSKFTLQVQNKKGKIYFHPGADNFTVMADARFIPVVILNLLDNAVKYCNSAPVINIETKNIGNKLNIIISDNGIGMSKDIQKRIFEKFYRVPSGNLHNIKGFGLGLSYVKAIVSAHGGTVHVSSDPGVGTRFEISLPVRQ